MGWQRARHKLVTKPSRILNFHPLMASYGGWQLDDKDTECFHHARKFSRSALDGQPHFTRVKLRLTERSPRAGQRVKKGSGVGMQGGQFLLAP